MSETKHTPGPWEIRDDHLGGIRIVSGKNDDGQFSSSDDTVAVAYLRIPSSEEMPNARLIAASPDLLAACRAFEAYYATTHPNMAAMMAAWDGLKSQVRDAVAKAEGKQP